MSRWTLPVAVVAGALVIGTGGYAVARSRDAGPAYRTAVATRGDVQRTLDLSGTVSATGRRDLGFAVAGTVAAVTVHAGQKVSRGKVLARLDPTALDAAVTSAVATLDRARAQLASDEAAQAAALTTAAASPSGSGSGVGATRSSTIHTPPGNVSAPSSGSGASGSATPGQGGAGSSGNGSGTAGRPGVALQRALATLATEQKAVTVAESDASIALATAKVALATQYQSCRAAASPAPTDQPTGQPTGQPSSVPAPGASSACTGALSDVQAAQETVAVKQDALQATLDRLAKTLGKTLTTLGQDGQTTGGATSAPTQKPATRPSSKPTAPPTAPTTLRPTTPAAGTASQATGVSPSRAGGATVTAARLAQDQAGIDTAQAQLTEARIARDAATLRAPYAGRILQVAVAKGDQASTSGTGFIIVGAGVTTVTTTVTTAQVPQVRRGQHASVLPAGWTTPLTGTVSAIGLLPGTDGTFAVTVTVASTRTVAEGTTASLAVVTSAARGVVTVPTSAVTRTGSRATVQVLDQGIATRTSVTVGVVGSRRTGITSGLAAGSTVVLADLGASLPSPNATQNGRFGGRGAAGLGGAGLRGGAFRNRG